VSDDDSTQIEILAANARFYTALAQADLTAMNQLWHHSSVTECIHPGWDRLRGWPAIHESWARIFQHQGALPVQFSEPLVHWRGDMAWVMCYENISLQQEEGAVQISQMVATNIFERVEGRWRMVVHHASPVPPGVIQPRTWRASLN
jgi:ketosteroid isomerase-like protein